VTAVKRFTAPGQPSATVYVSNTLALNKSPAR